MSTFDSDCAFVNLEEICRSCMSKKQKMRPLFGSSLDSMLMTVANVKVEIKGCFGWAARWQPYPETRYLHPLVRRHTQVIINSEKQKNKFRTDKLAPDQAMLKVKRLETRSFERGPVMESDPIANTSFRYHIYYSDGEKAKYGVVFVVIGDQKNGAIKWKVVNDPICVLRIKGTFFNHSLIKTYTHGVTQRVYGVLKSITFGWMIDTLRRPKIEYPANLQLVQRWADRPVAEKVK